MQENEIWKDFIGYEGLYMVSDKGNVKSLTHIDSMGRVKKGCQLKQMYDGSKNYLQVNLYKDGKHKTAQVHRLVAMAFVENENGHNVINHIDENKTNNHAENLEWCTSKYNSTYGKMKDLIKGTKNPNCKINSKIALEIYSTHVPGSKRFGTTALAKKYNISISHVSSIASGRRWGWLHES